MAVPKRKWSKARSRRARANWKISAPTLVECPRCKSLAAAHRACKNCGYYKGREIIAVEEK